MEVTFHFTPQAHVVDGDAYYHIYLTHGNGQVVVINEEEGAQLVTLKLVDDTEVSPPPVPPAIVVRYYVGSLNKCNRKVYSEEAYGIYALETADVNQGVDMYRVTSEEVRFSLDIRVISDTAAWVDSYIQQRPLARAKNFRVQKALYTRQEEYDAYMTRNYGDDRDPLFDILRITVFPFYTLCGMVAPGWVFFYGAADQFLCPEAVPMLQRIARIATLMTASSPIEWEDVPRWMDHIDSNASDSVRMTWIQTFCQLYAASSIYRSDYELESLEPGARRVPRDTAEIMMTTTWHGHDSGDCEDLERITAGFFGALVFHPFMQSLMPKTSRLAATFKQYSVLVDLHHGQGDAHMTGVLVSSDRRKVMCLDGVRFNRDAFPSAGVKNCHYRLVNKIRGNLQTRADVFINAGKAVSIPRCELNEEFWKPIVTTTCLFPLSHVQGMPVEMGDVLQDVEVTPLSDNGRKVGAPVPDLLNRNTFDTHTDNANALYILRYQHPQRFPVPDEDGATQVLQTENLGGGVFNEGCYANVLISKTDVALEVLQAVTEDIRLKETLHTTYGVHRLQLSESSIDPFSPFYVLRLFFVVQ